MTLIKIFIVTALILVTTFHSIAPAQASSKKKVMEMQSAIIQAINNWCDMKIQKISTPLHTVEYCRKTQKELASGCYKNDTCNAISQGTEKDMVELSHFTVRYLVEAKLIK